MILNIQVEEPPIALEVPPDEPILVEVREARDGAVGSPGTPTVVSAIAPASPPAGQGWLDTTRCIIAAFTGDVWVSGVPLFYAASTPATAIIDDIGDAILDDLGDFILYADAA